MSIGAGPDAVFVRRDEAEQLEVAGNILWLLADSSATGGGMSVVSTRLKPGGTGANPHHHTRSSEPSASSAAASTSSPVSASCRQAPATLAVAPAGLTRGFVPAGDEQPEMLIVLAPAVARFGYFRLLKQVTEGNSTFAEVLANQELYDNRFEQSAVWEAHRSRR